VSTLAARIRKGCCFVFAPTNGCRDAQHPTWRIKRSSGDQLVGRQKPAHHQNIKPTCTQIRNKIHTDETRLVDWGYVMRHQPKKWGGTLYTTGYKLKKHVSFLVTPYLRTFQRPNPFCCNRSTTNLFMITVLSRTIDFFFFFRSLWIYLWLAETSQQPISQTNWLKVAPHCNIWEVLLAVGLYIMIIFFKAKVVFPAFVPALTRCVWCCLFCWVPCPFLLIASLPSWFNRRLFPNFHSYTTQAYIEWYHII